MHSSIRLGRVFGIEIGFHYTWFIIFGLITWSLSAGYFPTQYPHWSAALGWTVGVLTSLLFFTSVVLHELGHSLVAIRRGIPVKNITLFVFGGAAHIEREVERPQDEVAITIAGPLVSLALALFFWVVAWAAQAVEPLAALTAWLARINLVLALFNLVPGFPLDGGRLLRAAVWAWRGDFRAATQVASRSGQLLAYLLMALGIFTAFAGNMVSGLWLIFLGWFLASAAEASYQDVLTRGLLSDVRVRQIMDRDPVVIGRAVSLRRLVDDYVLGKSTRAVLVVEDGELSGIITLTDVKNVPVEEWDNTTVSAVMTRMPLETVAADASVTDLIQRLGGKDLHVLPVLDGGRLVGTVNRSHVIRYLQVRQELGI